MCKKQTSVAHSSTASDIISLDAGLRLDGLPALELWDLIVSVLGDELQNLFGITQKLILDPSSRNSECDTSRLDSSFMDEIYTFSRSGKNVDESKSTCLLRLRLTLEENLRSFRIKSKMGKSSLKISTVQFLQRITWN